MEHTNKNFIKSHFKDFLLTILTCIFGFSLIKFPEASYLGVAEGARLSIEILIPSLFPFMFLSRFIVFSRMLDFLKKPLDKLTKFLFYLPGTTAPVIFLSLIGGFPIGAIGAKTLFENKEINLDQLNRMMCFTVNAGPAFIISVVGYSLLKNRFLGIVMFLIQIFLSLTYGILLGAISRIKKEKFFSGDSFESTKKVKTSIAIVESTSQASFATINMCFLVIVFTLIISLINEFNIINFLCSYLNINIENFKCLIISFLEITSGCSYAANHKISFAIISFAIGYGGICTHLQIVSIFKNIKFNYLKFHTFRIINAICSLLISIFVLNFFKPSVPTFLSSSNSFSTSISSTAVGSLAILILCIYFTLSQKNDTYR